MDYTYQLLIKPLLFRLEPEAAHDITVSLLKRLGGQSMLAKNSKEIFSNMRKPCFHLWS